MIFYTEWIYFVASAEAIFECIHIKKKVSVFVFRSYYASIMICYDADYLVYDNPLQTNGTPLLHLLQKALWQLLQLVGTDLCK